MTGLARRTGWSIRRVRTIIEITVLAIGVVLGGKAGLGTVLFALGVGPSLRGPHLAPRTFGLSNMTDAPTPPNFTGLTCPACRKHVAVIENRLRARSSRVRASVVR